MVLGSDGKRKSPSLRDEPYGRDATLHTVFGGRITRPMRPVLLGPATGRVASFQRAAPGSIQRLRLAPVHSPSGSLGLAGRVLIPFTAVGYSDVLQQLYGGRLRASTAGRKTVQLTRPVEDVAVICD